MVALALLQTGAIGYGVPVHAVADVDETLVDGMLVDELETDVGPTLRAMPTDGLGEAEAIDPDLSVQLPSVFA